MKQQEPEDLSAFVDASAIPMSRKKNGLMLDLCASDGGSLIAAAKKKYVSIGIARNSKEATRSLQNLQKAKTRGYVIIADIQELPFQPQLFDLVWSSRSCELNTKQSLDLFAESISVVMAKSGILKICFDNSRANGKLNGATELNGHAHHFKYPLHQDTFNKYFKNVHTTIQKCFGVTATKQINGSTSKIRKPTALAAVAMAKVSRILPALNRFSESMYINGVKNTGSPNFRIHHFLRHHWLNQNLNIVYLLQCPISGGPVYLSKDSDFVISDLANVKYPVVHDIPVMLREAAVDLDSNKTASEIIGTLSAVADPDSGRQREISLRR